MKKIVATLIIFVLAIAASLFVGEVMAEPLDDFKRGYESGTVLTHNPDYTELYSKSSNRTIEFSNVEDKGEWINAYYKTSMLYENEPFEQYGVTSLIVKDGVVTEVQFATIDKDKYDLAMAGQLADIGSTAIALSSGLSEMNPLAATPVGMAAVVGAKVGLVKLVESFPLQDCVASKAMLGGLGWGAAGWNIGIMVATAPVALAAGLVSGIYFWQQSKASAPTNCVKKV